MYIFINNQYITAHVHASEMVPITILRIYRRDPFEIRAA